MMMKEQGFHKECSPERCDHLEAYIRKHYERGTKREVRRKGGMDVQVLAPFHPNAGMPLRLWRCFEWEFVDRQTGEKRVETCTATTDYRVPQDTLDCYRNVSAILQTLRPIKRGRPARQEREKVSSEVLALAGCSARIERAGKVKRIYAPSQITPTIAAKVTEHDLRATRQAINNLVYQGKLVGAKKVRGEKAKVLLHVLQEKAYQMPKDYAVAFDDFLHAERKRRESASKKLFGKNLTAGFDVPTAKKREFRGGAQIVRRGEPMQFGMGADAILRAQIEAEEWRRRTGLAKPRYRNLAVGTAML